MRQITSTVTADEMM